MSLNRVHTLHLPSALPNLIFKRGIVIPQKKTPKKEKATANKSLESWAEKEEKRRIKQEEDTYKRKMDQLTKLTMDLKLEIKRKDDIRKQKKIQAQLDALPETGETLGIDALHESLNGSHIEGNSTKAIEGAPSSFKSLSLFDVSSNIIIPDSIRERLGLSIKYLISNENQNWSLVLSQLREAGGFKDITIKDATRLMQSIPLSYRASVIPQLHLMMEEANMKADKLVIDYFMSGFAVNQNSLETVEKYYQLMLDQGCTPTIHTFGHIIKSCGKDANIDKVSYYLKEMNKLGIQPSTSIYTNVLQVCIAANDNKQAIEIFDMLKFLSNETKPNTKTYSSMLILHVKTGEIERALDLYQEMITFDIEINQECLTALARGCASRPELMLRSWDFIFQIYESGFKPSLKTLEFIIYTSSKSGDLGLSRALFNQIYQNDEFTISEKCFNFLLMAYKNHDYKTPPSANASLKGREFRRNAVMTLDFTHPERAIPLLPVIELRNKEQILAESNALWKFMIQRDPNLMSSDTVGTLLNIYKSKSDLKSYKKIYEEYTFFDGPSVRQAIIEEPEIESVHESKSADLVSSEEKTPSAANKTTTIKIPRENTIYLNALTAASHYKNYEFAKQIWTERGLWRKNPIFNSLSPIIKAQKDFEFAISMVLTLTKLGLLDDALAIVGSTEKQFNWNFFHLKPLYEAAENIGDVNVKAAVSNICNKSKFYAGNFRKYTTKQ